MHIHSYFATLFDLNIVLSTEQQFQLVKQQTIVFKNYRLINFLLYFGSTEFITFLQIQFISLLCHLSRFLLGFLSSLTVLKDAKKLFIISFPISVVFSSLFKLFPLAQFTNRWGSTVSFQQVQNPYRQGLGQLYVILQNFSLVTLVHHKGSISQYIMLPSNF